MNARIEQRMKEVQSEYSRLNPDERIERTFSEVTRLCNEEPTTVVLNLEMFTRWYYYCEENELDYTKWRGVVVYVDRSSPALVAMTYHVHL